MRSYVEDTMAAGREVFPDLVRAWALFGICVVNVGVLSWPMSESYHAEGAVLGPIDQATWFGVNALFALKSYSLFSLMFGVGFAYQIQSAERRGIGFAGRYWRRILGLLAFGALNIALLFIGDILVVYAVMGSVLFLFRNSSQKTLVGWGIALYVIQILIVSLMAFGMYMGMTFAPDEMGPFLEQTAKMNAADTAAFGSGSLGDAIAHRANTYASGFAGMIMFQGVGALAFFLFGFAAVRAGVIANPSAPIWKKARWIGLPIGLVIAAFGAWIMVFGEGMNDGTLFIGMALITLGSPFSSFGYLGLIAKWAEGTGGPIRNFFARGGTSSLTAYLMQNAILSFTFAAYGFGFFAQWPAATAIGFAALVALFTIAFASIWRLYFSRGPLEYILRGITYAGAGR